MEPPRTVQSLLQSPPSSLSESDLALLWKHWLLRLEEVSLAPEMSVDVVQPGRFCPGEGPDFRDARVRLDGIPRVGAVELHRTPADWYRHGHHRDPAFNQVILHVCDRNGAPETTREDGMSVPILPLRPLLERYDSPEGVRAGSSPVENDFQRPCLRNPERTPGRCRTLLRRAARAWLGRVAARLRRLETDRRLWQPMVESLGYTRNHVPFRRLAHRVQPGPFYRRVRRYPDVNRTEAYLLGVAGWLPRPFQQSVNRLFYSRRKAWETAWDGLRSRLRGPADWNRGRVRPQSYPLRRWVQFGWASRRLEAGWREWFHNELLPIPENRTFRSWVRDRLNELLHFPSNSYWNHHLTRFDQRRASAPRPLGQAWYDQMTINVWIPYGYLESLRQGDSELRETMKRLFFNYPPVVGNRRTRRLLRLWRLEDRFRWQSAAEQQGAVFLWKQGCEPARCSRCALNPDVATTGVDEPSPAERDDWLVSHPSDI